MTISFVRSARTARAGSMCLAKGQSHPSCKALPAPRGVARGALFWQCGTAVVASLSVGHELGEGLRLLWQTGAIACLLFAALLGAPASCAMARRLERAFKRRRLLSSSWSSAGGMQACSSSASEQQQYECVTTIHGRKYDLSAFVSSHPGGPTALLLTHGTDATALFESYHPLSHLPAAVLARYEVGNSSSSSTGHSSRSSSGGGVATSDVATSAAGAMDGEASDGGSGSDSGSGESESSVLGWRSPRGRTADPMYDVMRERVAALFEARGKGTKASSARLAYYSLTIALWGTLCRGYYLGSWCALPWYVLCAWHVAGIGHDAAHFEVSTEPVVNAVLACCIGTISNPLHWYYQHTVGHHSHTNDPDKDPDLHHYDPFLRVHTRLAHQPWHRWQHYFVFPFMALFTFGQTLWQPLMQQALPGQPRAVNGITPILMQGRLRVHVLGYGMLLLYVYLHLLLPLAFHPSLLSAAAFFSIFLGGTGGAFGLASAINHLTPASAAVEPTPQRLPSSPNTNGAGAGGRLGGIGGGSRQLQQHSWAARQAVSSNNFCLGSPLAFWLSNALNYQVEHHLFPGINHEHLPMISPVVRATCTEFGVPYNAFASWTAIADEFRQHLRNLGDVPQHAKLE